MSLLGFINKVDYIIKLKGYEIKDIDLDDGLLVFSINNNKKLVFAYRYYDTVDAIINKIESEME